MAHDSSCPDVFLKEHPRALPEDKLRFTIKEGGETVQGETAFIVCVTIDVRSSGGYDIPVIYVLPDSYDVKIINALSNESSRTYYYTKKDGGKILSPAEGQNAKERIVELLNLNLLSVQNARSGLHISRNQEIAESGHSINNSFVYTTGDIQFDSSCFATRDIADSFNICSVQPLPLPRTIHESLDFFFNALFTSDNTDRSVTLQAEILYERYVHAEMNPVAIPVFMQIRQPFAVKALPDMSKGWEDAILNWCKTHLPGGRWEDKAQFRIDFTVFSHLTKDPMQMLRLRRLILPCLSIIQLQ